MRPDADAATPVRDAPTLDKLLRWIVRENYPAYLRRLLATQVTDLRTGQTRSLIPGHLFPNRLQQLADDLEALAATHPEKP